MGFRRVGVLLLLLSSIVLVARPWAQTGRGDPPPVVVLDVKGAIGVGTAHLIDEGFARAEKEKAGLLVLRLDTPGGLVNATRDIIQRILASPIPVAIFIGPSGARAASAGTYMAYAAHIAAMAPGTHLGAATPVAMGAPGTPAPAPQRPGDDKSPAKDQASAMERKVLNDAIAYIRSLAQLRGRNADWAEKAVRDAATLTAEDAEREKVVDLVAVSVPDLLDKLDGRQVRAGDGERTLQTRHARLIQVEPSWKVKLLAVVTDPNIAFILLMIGIYGIIFEFWTPGLAGPGIVGAICLIVGLMALSVMPLNFAGVALLVAGLAMLVAEAMTPGIGVLGIGGIVAFLAGGFFLFDPADSGIDFGLGWPVLIGAAATNALMIVGVLGMALRARRQRVRTGAEEMIGLEGEVIDWSGARGRVRVHGETWAARSPQALAPGARIKVGAREGLTLQVSSIAHGG
ncbi:MAG: nodulation protein NfeD [Enhydrobacter sp.]|nr:MAG: nodulation protein NfeD [Enhydrobacter sp.]